jgi:uncharacterized FAD-dependent dehydrogenase
MIRLSELKLPLSALPVHAPRAADAESETDQDRLPPPHPEAALRRLAAAALGLQEAELASLEVFKRSFDARKVDLLAVYIVDVGLTDPAQEPALLARHGENPHITATPGMQWQPVGLANGKTAVRPVVVGFGPCGIFAALVLAQMGFRPIVLERGKTVRERTRDTWGLWRKHQLNPESNVQFGEGGAGTFSDGKLYSQIKDPRHLGRKVMQEFVKAGAPPEILYEAHPHIGTFKLVKVVENLREQIIALGGEIRFEHRVTDVLIEEDKGGRHLRGLTVLNQATGQSTALRADHVILALGHSSRDTFAMLFERGVQMQAKAFSVGFRVEHPQGVIDRARWGRHAGHPLLGAADYKLVHHASNGRTAYSFCMCPGGTVVAATSEPGRVVTNGMSQYSRNERNANAGMVVGIDPSDYPADAAQYEVHLGASYGVEALGAGHHHPLSGIVLQRQLESHAYGLGGGDYSAPAQLVGDFIAGKPSSQLGDVMPSYKPGVRLGDLHTALPGYAIEALREALPAFGRKIKGFDRHDAVLTGVETRTSSPLKMGRDDHFQSLNTAACTPRAKGPATPAASCQRVWTASRSAKRWRAACWGWPEPQSAHQGGFATNPGHNQKQ